MQLVDARLLIRETTAFDAGQLGFIARILAQAGLPYADPGPDVHLYERSNGRFKLRVMSHVGIPYGTVPRVLLAFASTEAIRKKSPFIDLGKNVSAFLRDKLQLEVNGGERGNIGRVKTQAYRLFSSQISMTKEYSTGTEGRVSELYMNISDGLDLSWWAKEEASQDAMWESQIKLSQQFYDEVTNSPVPIDWRAVAVLKSSALALDIYFWLTHRMKYLKEVTTVPWFGQNGLYAQFGSASRDDHKGRYTFRKNTTVALSQVLSVYPDARVESTADGLVLKPSPTHVVALTSGTSHDEGWSASTPGEAQEKLSPTEMRKDVECKLRTLGKLKAFA
jgi:hypothetical protein